VPCGIDGVVMTSVAGELGSRAVEMSSVMDAVTRAFCGVFELAPRLVGADAVHAPPPPQAITSSGNPS